MKKNLSRILALVLSLTLILTSALAVFAETGAPDGAGDTGKATGTTAQAATDEPSQESGDQSSGSAASESANLASDSSKAAGSTDAEPSTGSGDQGGQTTADQGSSSTGGQGGTTTEAGEGTEPGGDDPQPGTDDPQPATYTVTWMNGTQELEKDLEVTEGSAPSFDGEAPTKASDSEYNYTFAGWATEDGATAGKPAAELPTVTFDVTYYAAFSKAAKPHVHTWSAWKVTVKATHFRTGTKVRTCSSCGATEKQTIAKLTAKNKWVKNPANGKWAYFGSNGKMYLSWHKMKMRNSKTTKWIYFSRGGAYVKSISKNTKNKWVKAGGYKFYFGKSKKPYGAGFHFIKGKLYHMDKYGAVMYGTFKASDGNTYTANSSGAISGVAYYKYKYKTFILIDISQQTLWYYKNGTQKLKADVVTGTKGKHNTPTGTYKVRSKQRNIYLNGATWSSHVDYWMAFIGSSHGMHDATWRSSAQFSNHKTYIKNGSHGCVNMRYSDAKKLYGMVSVGTKVIVQN